MAGCPPEISCRVWGLTRIHRALARSEVLASLGKRQPKLSRLPTAMAVSRARLYHGVSCLLGASQGILRLLFAPMEAFSRRRHRARIKNVLGQGSFRATFQRRLLTRAWLARIPTFVITASEPGLSGLALVVSHPESFIMELHGAGL